MRIAVIGAGGVGGYFGGRLVQSGVDTIFIVRGSTLAALRSNGLRIESPDGDIHLPSVQASDDPSSAGPVDAVLFAVKAWQIPEAAATALPLFGEKTIAVPLENGMEAPEELAAVVGAERVLGGLCAIVSYAAEPGLIRHLATKPLIAFGELDGSRSARVERLRITLEVPGIDVQVPPDIRRSMWTKFLFIAPMSGIGALTRVPIGIWRSMSGTRSMATAALEEIATLAAANQIQLDPEAIATTLERYDALPPQSTSSLQRDLMNGKPSELEAQLGAVVRRAAKVGVSVPVMTMIYHALLPQEQLARSTAVPR